MRYRASAAIFAATMASACGESDIVNRAPIALLGYDAVVESGEIVTFDASSSFDPDGQALEFVWSIDARPNGSRAELAAETGPANQLIVDANGIYDVSVSVSDGALMDSDSLRLFAGVDPLRPIARAGGDRRAQINMPIRLDGSMSVSPNGEPLTYFWSVVSGSSQFTLQSPNNPQSQFLSRVEGTYTIQLLVTDTDGNTDTDTVVVTVGGRQRAPVAAAGTNQTVEIDTVVTLDGRASMDPDGDPLEFSWRFVRRPANSSAVLNNQEASQASFTPDIEGAYDILLTVSDGASSAMASVTVTATSEIIDGVVQQLDFRVTDVEYDRASDRLVFAAGEAAKLVIYDPESNATTDLPLALAPTCLSLSDDGRFAAVGHDAMVSYLDLTAATVVKMIPVSAPIDDIVLAENGFIYARGPNRDAFFSIEIASATVTPASGFRFGSTDRMRLHASGERIYAANRGSSPDDIVRVDIAGGIATDARDSEYHGDYSMCGNLWLSRDGARIFTACGNVFRAAADFASDMRYNGALSDVQRLHWVDHSPEAAQVLAVPALDFRDQGNDRVVRFYRDDFLGFVEEKSLPSTAGGATGRIFWAGRYAFYSADGTRVYVVTQAHADSALLNDFGVHVMR